MPGGADRRGIVAAPQTPSGGADPAPRGSSEGSWGSWNQPSSADAEWRSVRGGLAQRAHRLLALVARRAVQDQDAVEVIHLVLEHARLQARGLDQHVVAALVLAADAHVDRPLDLDEY